MADYVGQWKATYTQGEWVVLSGPTSLVVLQPASSEWSTLINTIWGEVVASSSLTDLASKLAVFRIDRMPSFAAFFWTADGMRSLVRGEVKVMDLATGNIVANGSGVQTWSEVGLSGVEQVRIEMERRGGETLLELPLVVGVVRASSIVLDASSAARVFSPQIGAGPVEDALGQPEVDAVGVDQLQPDHAGPEDSVDETAQAAAPPDDENRDLAEPDGTESTVDLPEWGRWDLDVASPPQVAAGAVGSPLLVQPTLVPPPLDGPVDNADTELMAAIPSPPEPEVEADPFAADTAPMPETPRRNEEQQRARPIVAVLRSSTGESADVDRAVLVGRSPTSDRAVGESSPRLMAVPSPSHDISRTHLQVAPRGWQIEVTDLHSTNGTLLVQPGADRGPQRLNPGEPITVSVGCRLDLGDGVSLVIENPV